MKAFLKNYRQSPRKVRLVASLIRGKSVTDAENELNFLVKRAAEPFQKLMASAVANAKQNHGIDKDNLIVSEVTVDKGIVMKRMMPRAMGRGARINKRTSHLYIVLAERGADTTSTTKKTGKIKKAASAVKAVVAKAPKIAKKPSAVKKAKAK